MMIAQLYNFKVSLSVSARYLILQSIICIHIILILLLRALGIGLSPWLKRDGEVMYVLFKDLHFWDLSDNSR